MELTFDLVWMQTLSGGTETLQRDIAPSDALRTLANAQAEAATGEYGPGVILFLRPSTDALGQVAAELERARGKHAPLNSAHEAYAVMLEELEEFKAEVWKQTAKRDLAAMRAELIQLAAMALRTIEDLAL